MREITAEFEINTLLFMSGADQSRAELRMSSIKGVIRFWWRAMNYAIFEGDIKKMKETEDRLFGSTARQAGVRMKLIIHLPETVKEKGHILECIKEDFGARYLAYGVVETFDASKPNKDNYISQAGKLLRPCIEKGTFTITLISKSNTIKEDFNSVINAVKLFGLLGSLGSRARKGYGSVTLRSLRNQKEVEWTAPNTESQYLQAISELLQPCSNYARLPKYSAFSKHARIHSIQEGNSAMKLLGHYGLMMVRYRSSGKNGKIIDSVTNTRFDSENLFESDHDWIGDVNNFRENNPDYIPQRAVFGLPHTGLKIAGIERRSSPLFFHIHKLAHNRYLAIALILESEFLPANVLNGNLSGNHRHNNNTHTQETTAFNADFTLLDEFLSKSRKDTKEKYFPAQKRIWPAHKGSVS